MKTRRRRKTRYEKSEAFAAKAASRWYGVFTEGSLENIFRYAWLMGYLAKEREKPRKAK